MAIIGMRANGQVWPSFIQCSLQHFFPFNQKENMFRYTNIMYIQKMKLNGAVVVAVFKTGSVGACFRLCEAGLYVDFGSDLRQVPSVCGGHLNSFPVSSKAALLFFWEQLALIEVNEKGAEGSKSKYANCFS
jgi:hypothetical protein